ncbi:hypothetical protein [Glaciimonas soli]|uniref:DUF2782 domain-containing protein n=1 Tax=Glaciimonas soli TaxID=2590999 RepID=A0A843YQR1_9BURK|nr:hypothetical protein [Glaciimonas soli]MQR01420.1 hypothetical protein [Glaciimonas soli]
MKNSKIWAAATLCVSVMATPLLVHAQDKTGATAPPPPELQKLEEVSDDGTPLIKKDNNEGEGEKQITQKRNAQGVITEETVHSGGSTYKVTAPVSGSNHVKGAEWTIGTFGGPKPAKPDNPGAERDPQNKTAAPPPDNNMTQSAN